MLAQQEWRERVADALESCPFWTVVAILTIIDLILFVFQMIIIGESSTIRLLRTIELIISSIFVIELGIRCYTSRSEQLVTIISIVDAGAVLLSFILCLATISTPLLAARSARLLRLGSASSRCSRNAVNSSKSAIEMRNFFSNARRSGAGYARRVTRDADVSALFLDLTGAPELRSLLSNRPWIKNSSLTEGGARPRGFALHEMPVLAAALTLPQFAKAEIDKADANFLRARTARNQRQSANYELVSASNPLLNKIDPESPQEQSEDATNNIQDKKRVFTSAKALISIFEHALNQARTHDAPPPRLINTLRHDDVSLCFLKREI